MRYKLPINQFVYTCIYIYMGFMDDSLDVIIYAKKMMILKILPPKFYDFN